MANNLKAEIQLKSQGYFFLQRGLDKSWIQLASATNSSKNTSKGVLKSRHFLGR